MTDPQGSTPQGGEQPPGTPVAANLHYAGVYRASLEEAQRTGKCIFCDPEWQGQALAKVTDWFIRRNPFPTKDREGQNPEHHFLIVAMKHGNDTAPFRPEDWADIEILRRWVDEKFRIRGGGLCVRLGDPTICGRTVRHPHVHYIVPRMVDGKPIPVDFPVG